MGIANDIKQYSESLFGEISRVAAHLELAYHQVRKEFSAFVRSTVHSLMRLSKFELIAEKN